MTATLTKRKPENGASVADSHLIAMSSHGVDDDLGDDHGGEDGEGADESIGTSPAQSGRMTTEVGVA